METSYNGENCKIKIENFTKDDIKYIVLRHCENEGENHDDIGSYTISNASNKMLGFLAEYWKVTVYLTTGKVCYFFIKAISRTNVAKAEMIREMKLFDKELRFYLEVKKNIEVPDINPWSAKFITVLHDALVFEDLNALQYELKNKFERFDMSHTLQALKTLARFHASSIIFEEKKRKETRSSYRIPDDYEHILHKGGYDISSQWYIQCMTGALDAMKTFSKYSEIEYDIIKKEWHNIWSSALDINDCSSQQTNVICHRDLWNNNIMFHYKKVPENKLIPDNCLFVDFQAVRYQPPASDVMLLLCCNLDPNFRKENIQIFLNTYYDEIEKYLSNHNIQISKIMTKEDFFISAEEQTKWGLVVCACLIPQFWIDDDMSTTIFFDNEQFNDILCKNKGLFIKNNMQTNTDYKPKVMEIFEEIADRYCFMNNTTFIHTK